MVCVRMEQNLEPAKVRRVFQLVIHAYLSRPDTGSLLLTLIKDPALNGEGVTLLREALLDRKPSADLLQFAVPHSHIATPLGVARPVLTRPNLSWHVSSADVSLQMACRLIVRYSQDDEYWEFENATELSGALYELFGDDVDVLEILFQHALLAGTSQIWPRFFGRGLHLTGEHLDLFMAIERMPLPLKVYLDAIESPFVDRRTKQNCRPPYVASFYVCAKYLSL
jgi:hypothetical protein